MSDAIVQLPTDGTGKKVRTTEVTVGANLVEQQVINRAKSDGTLLDDEATETTLALVKAKTDNINLATTALRDAIVGIGPKTLTDIVTALANLANIDVALSTRTKPGDQQHVIVDTMTPALALDATVAARTKPSDQQHVVIDTNPVPVSGFPADQLVHNNNIDVALSTRTKPADQQHAIVDSGSLGVTNFPATQPVTNVNQDGAFALPQAANPVLTESVAGSDGSNIRPLRTNYQGELAIDQSPDLLTELRHICTGIMYLVAEAGGDPSDLMQSAMEDDLAS